VRKVLFALLMVWLVVFLAVPVSAAKPEPVGEPISLWFEDPMDFTAGEGFHIAHGRSIDPTAG
jgi:hypothetical protein